MGIDGISGRGPAGLGGITGPNAPVSKSDSFRLDPQAPAERTGMSDVLERVRSGELSLDQYLDGRVQEAVQHLVGKLSPDQLDFVRQSLREQLSSDPVLVELVQRTVGSQPTE
jgi:hypothetical protein